MRDRYIEQIEKSLLDTTIKLNDFIDYRYLNDVMEYDKGNNFTLRFIGEYLNIKNGETYNIFNKPLDISLLLKSAENAEYEPIFGCGLFILEVNEQKSYHFLATDSGLLLVYYNLF